MDNQPYQHDLAGGDQDHILDHAYDGIQEYDNPLPQWWLTIFWITIVFSPLYILYFHFGGGMLAMASVAATLETIRDENLASRALMIEQRLVDALKPSVVEIRGSGCLLGIEVTGPASEIVGALRAKGLLVGGSGDAHTFRLMPPLNCPQPVLDEAIDILAKTLESIPVYI